MRHLIPLLFFVSTAAAGVGTWVPTHGGAGERPVLAMAAGGDGALYAAGAGHVFRVIPGQHWKLVGTYAPTLQWDGDQEVIAEGPFPRAYLSRLSENVTAAVEGIGGVELSEESVSEDLVAGWLRVFVSETDTAVDSPYRVSRVVPATRGVWLGTGAGLFWADADGVKGPIGDVGPVLDLAPTPRGLAIASKKGLLMVGPDGQLASRRPIEAASLTTMDGRLAYLANGTLWWEGADGNPRALRPPTGTPKAIAGDRDTLWVATTLALYRYRAGNWQLCGGPGEPAERLTAGEGKVMSISESAIYVGGSDCKSFDRLPAPWPGGLVFTDATQVRGTLWAATTAGVFILGPPDDDARAALRMAGLRRAVSALPAFDEVVDDALEYQHLSRLSNGYGLRPVLRGLLPEVKVDFTTHWTRTEKNPTLVRGSEQLVTIPPEPSYRVMALWSIRLEALSALVAAEQTSDQETADREVSDVALEDDLINADGEVVVVSDADEADPDAIDAESFAKYAAERRQLHRDRAKLVQTLERLYRERLRLMYRIWIANTANLEVVVRIEELDALLDAATGGAYGRRKQ